METFVGQPIPVGNSLAFINPGAGPVSDAEEHHAVDNIRHFATDCSVKGVRVARVLEMDCDGRYGFLLWKGVMCHTVEMPGLPLDRVRFMGEPDQNIWHFPRLYVDGSSWVWKYALLDDEDFTLNREED